MSSVSAVSSTPLALVETTSAASAGSSDLNFSEILAETIKEQMTESVLTTVSGQSSTDSLGYTSMGGSLESLVATASATGEMSDLQTAILMLCMMLQSGSSSGSDSDFSPLMGVMASLFSALNGEDKETLYNNIMQSDYSPSTLVTVDEKVFGTKTTGMPGITGTGEAVIPTEAWKPTTPAVINDEQNRSAENLREVIDQFNVETSERYRPYRNGNTYCNIFVWDVTSAMGCEIPHYVDSATGAPRTYPDIQGAYEMDAAEMERWLSTYGSEYGWREVTAEEAQAAANEGRVAVTTAGSMGHVQVVCPSENGGFDKIRGVTVAQAGSKVYNYTYLSNIYSASSQSSIRYFVHE